jgi:hypothetical protein
MREETEMFACHHKAESSRTHDRYDIGKTPWRHGAYIRYEDCIDNGEMCSLYSTQEMDDCRITKDLEEIDHK